MRTPRQICSSGIGDFNSDSNVGHEVFVGYMKCLQAGLERIAAEEEGSRAAQLGSTDEEQKLS